MKKTGKCPKCGETPVMRLPRVPDLSRNGVSSVRLYHPGLLDALQGRVATGTLEAWVCPECGYTELYTDQPRTIPLQHIEGAELVWAPEAEAERLAYEALQKKR
ncbi:MAG: hypothetical protein R3F59_09715 [Myxococcota bacterium]